MKIRLMILGFGFLFLNGTAALAAPYPLEKFDNFNKKRTNGCKYCLDSRKWRGLHEGDYLTEVLREVKARRARLTARGRGTADSDSGTEEGRNGLYFAGETRKFSGACFTPRVKKYELENCPANPGASTVGISYTGNFYDNLTGPPGGFDGIAYAGFRLQRAADSPRKKDIFRVIAWIDVCQGVDCSGSYYSTTLDFGTVNASKNKKELCVEWDELAFMGNGEFVFSFGNDVRKVGPSDGLFGYDGNVGSAESEHFIAAEVDAENCAAGEISGFIDAEFDNVKFSENPFIF